MHDSAGSVPESVQRQLAVDLFNHAWTLMDLPHPTVDQIDEMIHAAHASCFHWLHNQQPVNQARGHWQISRVYCHAGRPEAAEYHARRCLEIILAEKIGDWDLAFAYEACARAAAVREDWESVRRWIGEAEKAGEEIQEEENRQLLTTDLATIPRAATPAE